ncbi:MAG: NAD(P)H-dependent flavin oxidoreductase [Culicoidibacterales bacterium]
MKGFKIRNFEFELPVVQGGMGIGISWDRLAGTVSNLGGLGTISAVGTGYYQGGKFANRLVKGRPFDSASSYSPEGLKEIFKNARKICGNKPLACNILHVINDYARVVKDAIEAGANIIVTGAGLPLELASLVIEHPEVAIVPIVSSARALKIIAHRWKKAGRLPDAVIVEGPKSGGHQGVKVEELFSEEHTLEAILPDIVKERDTLGDFPIIVAGGIYDAEDVRKFRLLGADAVQLGTRFVATYESDASDVFKQKMVELKEEDIIIIKSPVGYPARAMRTPLTDSLDENGRIQCISNCVAPCKRGEGARKVGYCIADSLADAVRGLHETGLFFTGSNGYRVDKIISVRELLDSLIPGFAE